MRSFFSCLDISHFRLTRFFISLFFVFLLSASVPFSDVIVNPGTGSLVSWWSFEESSGARVDRNGVNDFSPGASNPSQVSGVAGDVLNNGVRFESTTIQYLAVNDNSYNNLSGTDFCLGGWIKTDSNRPQYYFSKYGATSEFFIYSYAGGFSISLYNGSTVYALNYSLVPYVNLNQWYFVVGCYNSYSDLLSFRVDDLPVQYLSVPGVNNSSSSLMFGSYVGASEISNFSIDEWFLYKRTLSDPEVAFLYNSGRGRDWCEIISACAIDTYLAPLGEVTIVPSVFEDFVTDNNNLMMIFAVMFPFFLFGEFQLAWLWALFSSLNSLSGFYISTTELGILFLAIYLFREMMALGALSDKSPFKQV